MVKCSWCEYDTTLVFPNFEGYKIFDKNGYVVLNYSFCSINCGLANLNSNESDTILINERRINYLYENYNVKTYVFPAGNPRRLQHRGGNLTYEEFRSEFKCPNVNEIDKLDKNSSYDYKEYYDDEYYDDYREECDDYREECEENSNNEDNENLDEDKWNNKF
jgi:hypothetical protein